MPMNKTPHAPEISVVVPVYSSEATLPELYRRLTAALQNLVGERYELIFLNDGSRDGSWPILKSWAEKDPTVVAVNLTRNFGQHNALMCGFFQASGQYIVTLDDDLQNPPEEIEKLYAAIQGGHDVVYGIFDAKQHTVFKNIGSELVQFIYRKTFNLRTRITSFRILKKHIAHRLLSYDRSFTFLDGLIAWFTTNIGNVTVEHHKRAVGNSGYSFRKLVTLALNMLTNFSIVPLQLASLFGISSALIGFSFGCYFLLKKIIFDIPVSGFTSLIVSITIFAGVQLLTVGMLGEYIGRIHINVSKRPQYAIREIVTRVSSTDTMDHWPAEYEHPLE